MTADGAPGSSGEVRIRILDDVPSLKATSRLLERVWDNGPDDDLPVAPDLLRALEHTGGYVGGAFLDGTLVGAAVGFLARGGTLHSHVTGIEPSAQGRGIGRALKEHQRSWAREQGLAAVSWTFDPLQRRNARFNLGVLGARVEEYLVDFYGPLADGINRGDASDRLFVRWAVEPESRMLSVPGEVVSLALDEDGVPREPDQDADLLLCATPASIDDLRRDDPEAALRWRRAVRDTLVPALATGWRVTGFDAGRWELRRIG